MNKKEIIRKHVEDMLQGAHKAMVQKITKLLESGAVNIEGYDPKVNPMILPKCIVIALLENEAKQYDAKGTAFEKQVSKEVKNLKLFI